MCAADDDDILVYILTRIIYYFVVYMQINGFAIIVYTHRYRLESNRLCTYRLIDAMRVKLYRELYRCCCLEDYRTIHTARAVYRTCA